MIESLSWLGLAIDDPVASNAFYESLLGKPVQKDSGVWQYRAGEADLILRPPGSSPRGGKHVHFALSTGDQGYATYKERMADLVPVEEHELDVYRSIYGFDPDGHCVEFAQRDVNSQLISNIFEIVLEVASLENAEDWYRRLEPRVMDRGETRRRVRLDMGAFELELWEPQRGIADAKPGKHVDIGLNVGDVEQVANLLEQGSQDRNETSCGHQITDPDGHVITLVASSTNE